MIGARSSPTTTLPFPRLLLNLTVDMFALVQYWEPPVEPGPQRGRYFEEAFVRYCRGRKLRLSEQPGSRTLNEGRSASRFLHENDAVIATPDMVVHFELKHVNAKLQKNELLIFNQKGIDYLFARNSRLRRQPLFRVLLSGNVISPAARRFALQWGIAVVEPDRLPLMLLYVLAEQLDSALYLRERWGHEEIRTEIPQVLLPLQSRIGQLSSALSAAEPHVLLENRVDRVLDVLQREYGDRYWDALDRAKPHWLEDRYEILSRELRLEEFG